MKDGGLKSFQQRMKAIPRESVKAIEPALLKSAYEMQDMMEDLVPEDTGDLKGSITVTGPGRSTPAYSQPGGSHTVPSNGVAVTAGNTDVRYAHIVEYGSTRTDAKPFFWPSYRLLKKRSANRIKNAISKAIREARK
ncbi:hypothetical protein RUESEDTHA_00839 [Ruegeria sp. THAF57]|uniref:HK97-gp10 family putative phage morphogenesis protein n=1 Tax=Ruegeria sp. THAF57 TaxID=2744555 RepID=UPI0015E023DF|nr:hypothetical protein RUESEDTHA_00839 [Ruegeria sp. THAF57]